MPRASIVSKTVNVPDREDDTGVVKQEATTENVRPAVTEEQVKIEE
jgi:hypothetical protein